MTIVLLEMLTSGLRRLAEAAASTGHQLYLFTGDRSFYSYELSQLSADELDVVDIDTNDTDACETALRKIPDLAGLISSTDGWALPGAELANRLGLPGPCIEIVRTLRDKGEVRELLHREGLSRSSAVSTEPTASSLAEAANFIRFPLVFKDSSGTASRSVWLVRDQNELDRAIHEVEHASLKGHLIAERYFAGPLYSTETITWNGHTRLLGVTSRLLSPEPLRREEASSFPVSFPADDHATLEKWISRVLASVGFRQGFAHTELILTADGPEVVEINGRIGGALVGETMCRSLGTNVYTDLISMALGEEPALLTETLRPGPGAAFAGVYPSRAGILDGWSGLDRLSGLPGNPEWFPTASPGGHIEHLVDQRGCTGLVLAEGATSEIALYNALTAMGGINPHMTSAPGLDRSGGSLSS